MINQIEKEQQFNNTDKENFIINIKKQRCIVYERIRERKQFSSLLYTGRFMEKKTRRCYFFITQMCDKKKSTHEKQQLFIYTHNRECVIIRQRENGRRRRTFFFRLYLRLFPTMCVLIFLRPDFLFLFFVYRGNLYSFIALLIYTIQWRVCMCIRYKCTKIRRIPQ